MSMFKIQSLIKHRRQQLQQHNFDTNKERTGVIAITTNSNSAPHNHVRQ